MKLIARLLKYFFSGYVSFIASLASIIGVIIIFMSNKNQIIIALLAFILFLVIILFRVFYITKTFILQKANIKMQPYNCGKSIDFHIIICVQTYKIKQWDAINQD